VTERGYDNVRIATKVLTYFVVGLSILLVVQRYIALPPAPSELGIYPDQPSLAQKVGGAVYVLLLFFTFVLPLLVLRRELQRRRRSKNVVTFDPG
jgi:hypothetical protein